MTLRGIILAGGRSRRMGRDKARMLWRGRTLLDHARALLGEAGASDTVVLGREGVAGGVADLRPDTGPAVALGDYLGAHPLAPGGIAIVVPVDMPGLTPSLLAPLIAATPAHYEGHPLPLTLGGGVAMPEAGSLKALLRACEAASIAVPPQASGRLANLNTPQAWTDARAKTRTEAWGT